MVQHPDEFCILNVGFEVGGERFETGERLRVATRHRRGKRETLTLDGNVDGDVWTCRRVLHHIPVDDVTFV